MNHLAGNWGGTHVASRNLHPRSDNLRTRIRREEVENVTTRVQIRGTSRVGAFPSRGTKLPLNDRGKWQGEGRVPLTRQPVKPLVVLEAVFDVVDLAPRCRFRRGHTRPTTCRGSSSLAPATLALRPAPARRRTNIPFFPKGHFHAMSRKERSFPRDVSYEYCDWCAFHRQRSLFFHRSLERSENVRTIMRPFSLSSVTDEARTIFSVSCNDQICRATASSTAARARFVVGVGAMGEARSGGLRLTTTKETIARPSG